MQVIPEPRGAWTMESQEQLDEMEVPGSSVSGQKRKTPTCKFPWSEEHMRPFLQAFRRQDCLWNMQSAAYHDEGRRRRALRDMLIELQAAPEFQDPQLPPLEEAHLRAKINSTRTTYRQQLAKIKKSERSGAGADDVYRPGLQWFKEADAFMRRVCEARSSSSNLDVSSFHTLIFCFFFFF